MECGLKLQVVFDYRWCIGLCIVIFNLLIIVYDKIYFDSANACSLTFKREL